MEKTIAHKKCLSCIFENGCNEELKGGCNPLKTLQEYTQPQATFTLLELAQLDCYLKTSVEGEKYE